MAKEHEMFLVQNQGQNGTWIDVAGATTEVTAVSLMTSGWNSSAARRVIEQSSGRVCAWMGTPLEETSSVRRDPMPELA